MGTEYRRPGRAAMAVVIAVFAAALFCQWWGNQSVAVADGISYMTGGVNLVRWGVFRNPFGRTEVWFPPLYPLTIGVLSLGGYWDPLLVARLISAGFAVLCLILVYRAGSQAEAGSPLVGIVAAVVLALNPTYQDAANASLSQS